MEHNKNEPSNKSSIDKTSDTSKATEHSEQITNELIRVFRSFHRLNWRQKPNPDGKFSEMQVLMCIKRGSMKAQDKSGMKISVISRLLRVTSPTVTQLVNGMEANGLVQRNADPDDRRAVRISLTEEGDRKAKMVIADFMNRMAGLAQYLGEQDSLELIRILSKAFEYFDELNESELTGDEQQC
ncbi:DNA-binding transcriptional regulator, MarR family [Paenibacillus algorifonticola]|uniref:DNA-binding transcriptional regulator, MarR family n=1 Tax=Paenibacillus algorifonticola TaxID=684063 RepID=A0A1I2A2B8_9BACL|nr:MarR family winged helix-turn-helix transcriptional regulator [Paenibacillus algorifonticola]SFE38125.1 DNA-binding transcriptional regulator, MarR family [Paenibacillus algorifonticola]